MNGRRTALTVRSAEGRFVSSCQMASCSRRRRSGNERPAGTSARWTAAAFESSLCTLGGVRREHFRRGAELLVRVVEQVWPLNGIRGRGNFRRGIGVSVGRRHDGGAWRRARWITMWGSASAIRRRRAPAVASMSSDVESYEPHRPVREALVLASVWLSAVAAAVVASIVPS